MKKEDVQVTKKVIFFCVFFNQITLSNAYILFFIFLMQFVSKYILYTQIYLLDIRGIIFRKKCEVIRDTFSLNEYFMMLKKVDKCTVKTSNAFKCAAYENSLILFDSKYELTVDQKHVLLCINQFILIWIYYIS